MRSNEGNRGSRIRLAGEIMAAVATLLAIIYYLTGFYPWLEARADAVGSGPHHSHTTGTGGSSGGDSSGGDSSGVPLPPTNAGPRWLDQAAPISGTDLTPQTGVETVAGVSYGHSIVQQHDETCCSGTPITSTFAVPNGYRRLRVLVGIGDDSAANQTNQPRVLFEILVNGSQVVLQRTVSWMEQAVPFTVPLHDANIVTLSSALITTDCGLCGAQATWARARLLSDPHS